MTWRRRARLRGLAAAVLLSAACARSLQPVHTVPEAPAEPLPPEPLAVVVPAPPPPLPPALAPLPAPAKPPASPPAVRPGVTVVSPERIRVGLATDLAQIMLPCCGSEVTAQLGTARVPVISPLRVEPLSAVAGHEVFRLQVAALKDEGQAKGLADKLQRSSGEAADSVFDARTDLYRVRIGRYATHEAAEAALKHLQTLGLDAGWVVSEGSGVGKGGLKVTQGGKETHVAGRWLMLQSAGSDGIRLDSGRYRGRVLVYLNDRGTLNLINELTLEDYLRGVIPNEMGPRVFNQLEALKAQAVAARTYTVRTLGEFSDEGYDICATPRCQVYRGMESEDPLTDQAVAATAGQILVYGGEPIDALYSSTCGGRTEDVSVMFPLKVAPYLRGVPCYEEGMSALGGTLPRGERFPAALTRRLVPPAPGLSPAADLGARLTQLARLAGLTPPEDRLASLDRGEVQRYLASIFDLALDARLFVAPPDLAYLVADPPAAWSAQDIQIASYFSKTGLLDPALDHPLAADEAEGLLLRLAVYLGVLREDEGSFRGLAQGELRVALKDEEKSLPLPGELATFRRQGVETLSGDLSLVPGDRLRLYSRGDQLSALVQEIQPQGVGFDRTSNRSSWTRFRTDTELATLVKARYPGLDFASFEVISRGSSGRVARLRLHGKQGDVVDVNGLAVRWTLDVPDNLFTFKRLSPQGRPAGWLFSGRGWGHGVGLCQVGAYGMALRGHDYSDILLHYYSGVEFGRLVPPATSAPAVR
ncbi:MAG: SpoIID/LytB domain-containing protein [Acidobacteriota bacterium]